MTSRLPAPSSPTLRRGFIIHCFPLLIILQNHYIWNLELNLCTIRPCLNQLWPSKLKYGLITEQMIKILMFLQSVQWKDLTQCTYSKHFLTGVSNPKATKDACL